MRRLLQNGIYGGRGAATELQKQLLIPAKKSRDSLGESSPGQWENSWWSCCVGRGEKNFCEEQQPRQSPSFTELEARVNRCYSSEQSMASKSSPLSFLSCTSVLLFALILAALRYVSMSLMA